VSVRYKIARVWGKADSFDIEFTHKGGTRWSASVPPDYNDGVYACEIWALNEYGETAYWAGVLFMCDGVCCIDIKQSGFQIWIQPRRLQFTPSERIQFIVRKGCTHVRK